jgi:hypothetical protein
MEHVKAMPGIKAKQSAAAGIKVGESSGESDIRIRKG